MAMRDVNDAPIEIRTTNWLSQNLALLREQYKKYPGPELAIEIQRTQRELDFAVSINRKIMRIIT